METQKDELFFEMLEKEIKNFKQLYSSILMKLTLIWVGFLGVRFEVGGGGSHHIDKFHLKPSAK